MDEYRSSHAFLDWAFAMMDLEEARISLGSYAARLDLGCGLHKLAVDLAAKEKTGGLIQQRATGLVDKSIGELRRLQKEAVILCILVDEGSLWRLIGLFACRLSMQNCGKPKIELLPCWNRQAPLFRSTTAGKRR